MAIQQVSEAQFLEQWHSSGACRKVHDCKYGKANLLLSWNRPSALELISSFSSLALRKGASFSVGEQESSFCKIIGPIKLFVVPSDLYSIHVDAKFKHCHIYIAYEIYMPSIYLSNCCNKRPKKCGNVCISCSYSVPLLESSCDFLELFLAELLALLFRAGCFLFVALMGPILLFLDGVVCLISSSELESDEILSRWRFLWNDSFTFSNENPPVFCEANLAMSNKNSASTAGILLNPLFLQGDKVEKVRLMTKYIIFKVDTFFGMLLLFQN